MTPIANVSGLTPYRYNHHWVDNNTVKFTLEPRVHHEDFRRTATYTIRIPSPEGEAE